MGPIYYRDSHGAVLVYDITDEDSFQKVRLDSRTILVVVLHRALNLALFSSPSPQVKNWVKELKKMQGKEIQLAICGELVSLCLCVRHSWSSSLVLKHHFRPPGNKIDLEKQRTVDQATAEA